MGASPGLETRFFELDGEHLKRHVTDQPSTVDKSISINDIKDIRKNIHDPNLLKLAHKRNLPVLEIVTGTEYISMACDSVEELDAWMMALQAARDQVGGIALYERRVLILVLVWD